MKKNEEEEKQYIIIIDLKSAFDKVNGRKIWRILGELEVQNK